MDQHIIDFEAATRARDAGIAQSLAAAERRDEEWPERALGFLHRYALSHQEFTVEEMTAEAKRLGYGSPADDRAWGSVVRRASVSGFIRNTHRTRPRLKGHGSPGPVWASLVYVGMPA